MNTYVPKILSERGQRRYDRVFKSCSTHVCRGVFRRQQIKGTSKGVKGNGRYLSNVEINKYFDQVIGVIRYHIENFWTNKDLMNIYLPPVMLYNSARFIGGKDRQPSALRNEASEIFNEPIRELIYMLADIGDQPMNETHRLNYEYLHYIVKALIETLEEVI